MCFFVFFFILAHFCVSFSLSMIIVNCWIDEDDHNDRGRNKNNVAKDFHPCSSFALFVLHTMSPTMVDLSDAREMSLKC